MSATLQPPLTPPPVDTDHAEEVHWTERHGKSVIFLILTLVAVGIYLALSIPIAVFPDTNFPRIVIGADSGVVPIDQMMVNVTRPLEEAVNSVQGLDHVWSITSRGTAEVDLFFNWNVDMYRTLELVNAAVARVQNTFPPDTKIVTNRLTFAVFPIIGYSLTSDTIPQTRLWEIATYDMKPRLNRVAGVSTVVVQGGQVPEFEIRPDPAKLVQTQTTVPNILDSIARTNLIDSPGLIEMHHQLVLSLVSGQAKTPGEIAGIVVKTTPAGAPVHVGDLGQVLPSVMPVYTLVTANGKPAVLLNINRQPDGNTVAVANGVHQEIESLKRSIPPGIEIRPFYDQSLIVNDSITSVRDAILLGLILASLIMVLFLRDWGTSLVAGLVIPATIAVTFIALRLLNQSFNLMTLGGLAAAVGLVIDDAIVVVENIVLHRDSGQSRSQAIRSALLEIRKPLIGSTITPIVVFLPLITMTGVNGVFFRALAVTVGVALLTSLALALTWTPTLSLYFIRSKGRNGAHGSHEAGPTRLTRAYERILRFSLEHWYVLALGAVLLAVGSWFAYSHTGSDLLPAMDEGGFILDYITPAGSSLDETNRMVSHIEQILRNTPEVESTSRRTGMQLGLAAVTEANRGDFSVKLKPKRSRGVEDVIADVRAKVVHAEPLVDVEFPQVLQDMIGDLTSAPEPVNIKLFSQDPAQLKTWAPKVAAALKKVPGVVDIEDGIENSISGPSLTFKVDPVAAARTGFTPQEVEVNTSAILQGEPATTPVVLNGRPYTIRVRLPQNHRASLDDIRATLLVSGTGKVSSLGDLATFTEVPGETEIRRENLQRDVVVIARFENISLGEGMDRVKKAVNDLHIPGNIRVEYGGQYEEQQKSFKDLVVVLALAVVLVFMVLLFEFGGFSAPIAVLSSALLSVSGVFLALLITGTTFNLSSFMGLIMVIGIVAKNGILLLDADEKFRREGLDAEEAMIRAGERRLRPIMMTALATMAGMIPLALGWGAGSQMLQPLAIAVIGGILASMVLSLVVTPAVHFYIGGKHA